MVKKAFAIALAVLLMAVADEPHRLIEEKVVTVKELVEKLPE